MVMTGPVGPPVEWWEPPRGVEREMWFEAVNEVQEAVGEASVRDPEKNGGHSAKALFALHKTAKDMLERQKAAEHELLHAVGRPSPQGVVTLPSALPVGSLVRMSYEYDNNMDFGVVTRTASDPNDMSGTADMCSGVEVTAISAGPPGSGLPPGWVRN